MGVFRIGRGGSRVQTGSNVNGNDYDSEEPEASLWYSRTARLAGASLSRVCEAAILCLMLGLVLHSMKGLSFQAKHGPGNKVSYPQLFNFHPFFNILAFPIFMAEAVQSWSAPILPVRSGGLHKALHVLWNMLAVVCNILALVAVYMSHSLSVPKRHNLNSTHAYLGILMIVLVGTQFLVAMYFLLSRTRLTGSARPLHKLLGYTVFYGGLATVMTGVMIVSDSLTTTGTRLAGFLVVFVLLLGAVVAYNLMSGYPQSSAGMRSPKRAQLNLP